MKVRSGGRQHEEFICSVPAQKKKAFGARRPLDSGGLKVRTVLHNPGHPFIRDNRVTDALQIRVSRGEFTEGLV